jgi:3-deoxy-7-phosphoheptulonate synthase
MPDRIDDLRISDIKELTAPEDLLRDVRLSDSASETVLEARAAIHRILHGQDDRILVVVGPCSIHDPAAARDYAQRLAGQRRRLSGDLEIVMRVYFEKPRTTVGWKGLINDPDLDGSFHINRGLAVARRLLLDINEMGLPAGSEYLDMITPQYIADLISWGAIGARTTESQVHRELASGLSCPIGFKNGTEGNLGIAFEAVLAASQPHHFLGVTKSGRSAILATTGNQDSHVILRGGKDPNYDRTSIAAASAAAEAIGLPPRFLVDASHGNSRKKHENQRLVIDDVAGQLAGGEERIFGVMIESHLLPGRQDLKSGVPLTYGQSVTDSCIGWDETVELLNLLAEAVKTRRSVGTK